MRVSGRPSSKSFRFSAGTNFSFVAILVITAALFVAFLSIQEGQNPLSNPVRWLDDLDRDVAFEAVSNAANLLAAILAIAITVVAIVVELAANRYSHQISSLFIKEPINIVVMSFFVVATIFSIWVALSLSGGSAADPPPKSGLLLSMIMVTISLIILLPYFAFVLSFLSPVNVIDRIRRSVFLSAIDARPAVLEQRKSEARDGVDELQDIARRANELSDRAVAMASINALAELVRTYQTMIPELPPEWFEIGERGASDPDFVSLSRTSKREIERSGTWFEVKVMRQYLDLVSDSKPSSRDISYLVAINTRQIGVDAIGRRPQLVDLCMRCFNSYLRATINNRDQRTSYYIMNQYRLLAENLLKHKRYEDVLEIASHFQFYGLLGYRARIPFLLEVAAYDMMHLIRTCAELDCEILDQLLELILALDQEARAESQEGSLLGVRRVQIQLASFFLERGDEARARRISKDLQEERPDRLATLYRMLRKEDRPHYWEFTDRGVNFSYLAPKYRRHLDTLSSWLNLETTAHGS